MVQLPLWLCPALDSAVAIRSGGRARPLQLYTGRTNHPRLRLTGQRALSTTPHHPAKITKNSPKVARRPSSTPFPSPTSPPKSSNSAASILLEQRLISLPNPILLYEARNRGVVLTSYLIGSIAASWSIWEYAEHVLDPSMRNVPQWTKNVSLVSSVVGMGIAGYMFWVPSKFVKTISTIVQTKATQTSPPNLRLQIRTRRFLPFLTHTLRVPASEIHLHPDAPFYAPPEAPPPAHMNKYAAQIYKLPSWLTRMIRRTDMIPMYVGEGPKAVELKLNQKGWVFEREKKTMDLLFFERERGRRYVVSGL